MNPSARLSISLLLALVLWLPTLSASLRGDVDLSVAAVRYLLAFLLARVAVGGVAKLLEGYAQPTDDEPVDDVAAGIS
jgi:hypothetical protein